VTTADRRPLRPGGPAARHELAGLLANVWACEVVRPSGLLVLAVPQLADGPAVDNRGGSFSGIEPGWDEREVRVSDVLLRTAARGGRVWVVTRRTPDRPNVLLARLRERAAETGATARLRTAELDTLPAAGLFADGFTVRGPILLGEDGPDFLGEAVVFDVTTDPNRITLEGWLS
jgi:hypothetical protein